MLPVKGVCDQAGMVIYFRTKRARSRLFTTSFNEVFLIGIIESVKRSEAQLCAFPSSLPSLLRRRQPLMRSAFPALKLCGLRIPDHTRCGGHGCQGPSAANAGTHPCKGPRCYLVRPETEAPRL